MVLSRDVPTTSERKLLFVFAQLNLITEGLLQLQIPRSPESEARLMGDLIIIFRQLAGS